VLATVATLRVYYAKQQLAVRALALLPLRTACRSPARLTATQEDFLQGNFHGVKKPRQVISFGLLARVAMGRQGR
jgi:hypothetical protein